jgi:hypothetical protein
MRVSFVWSDAVRTSWWRNRGHCDMTVPGSDNVAGPLGHTSPLESGVASSDGSLLVGRAWRLKFADVDQGA